ncbi:MAG: hypothetical protein L3J63_10610, partial [Geopsychrobacter sp.]|nr:hypothetical protein [Geopsychrobacter sp.]
MQRLPISSLRVPLAKGDLQQMMGLVRLSAKLLQNPAYRQFVAGDLPESARFVPGNAGVMMGYDFHLTSAGPRLIEVNTNAGGSALSLRACQDGPNLTPSLRRRLRRMFLREWLDFNAGQRPLQSIVILDEKPLQQALYPEMKCFVDWLTAEGLKVKIADPSELEIDDQGVRLAGMQVDLIYNRHCDFYLEDPVLAAMRNAYLERRFCLTPYPFVYGH